MIAEKRSSKKVLLLFILVIGISSIIYCDIINYGMSEHTVGGQIIDVKETTFIESMNNYKDLYMIKQKENNEYYIEFKHNTNLPTRLKVNEENYDKIVSGKYYFVTFKCKGDDYKNAQFVTISENDPTTR